MRVGLVAVAISLVIGGLLGLLAGFYEGMAHHPPGAISSSWGCVGLFLGLLPAWIADQSMQVILVCRPGAALSLCSTCTRRKILARVADLCRAWAAGNRRRAWLAGQPHTLPWSAGVLGLLIGVLLWQQPGRRIAFEYRSCAVMDIVLSFPSYLLAIAIVAFLGPGLEKGMIAIGIVGIPVYRPPRALGGAVGGPEGIYPGCPVPWAKVTAGSCSAIFFRIFSRRSSSRRTMGLASAILSAPRWVSWAWAPSHRNPNGAPCWAIAINILTSGAWWAVVFPGLAIMLMRLGFNLLGDGLRDALDPKLQV